MPLIRRTLLALWLASGAPAAWALCVLPLCTCSVATTSVAFGSYNPIANSAVDAVGNVRVDCGGVAGLLIPYTISLGQGSGASYSPRTMNGSGGRKLPYNLYIASDRQTVWGDGNGSTQTVSGGFLLDALGLAPPQNNYVYGRIPSGQPGIVPGSYTDSVVVTVTYQ